MIYLKFSKILSTFSAQTEGAMLLLLMPTSTISAIPEIQKF